jgi:hypothetical protein
VDAPEAALVEDVTVHPVASLAQLMAHLRGDERIQPYLPDTTLLEPQDDTAYPYDLAAVRGQEHVKRALEVAASGGHNIVMAGTPGTGKTLLARTVPSILPPSRSTRRWRSPRSIHGVHDRSLMCVTSEDIWLGCSRLSMWVRHCPPALASKLASIHNAETGSGGNRPFVQGGPRLSSK